MIDGKLDHGRSGSRLARPVRDFLTGLLIFAVLAGAGVLQPTGAWLTTSAQAEVATLASAPLAASPHDVVTLICLALSFASLFTLNLWFARHVRQAHATYRATNRARR